MNWRLSWRASPFANDIAKRHYTCQSPDSSQFVPPGRCLVLEAHTAAGRAYWVTSWPFGEYVKHDWPGAWICSAFRNEGAGIASTLIRDAVAATLWRWPVPPSLGMITFIEERKVRPTMVRGVPSWGRCYRLAGFVDASPPRTKAGLLALQLHPEAMPPPCAPLGTQQTLEAFFYG